MRKTFHETHPDFHDFWETSLTYKSILKFTEFYAILFLYINFELISIIKEVKTINQCVVLVASFWYYHKTFNI